MRRRSLRESAKGGPIDWDDVAYAEDIMYVIDKRDSWNELFLIEDDLKRISGVSSVAEKLAVSSYIYHVLEMLPDEVEDILTLPRR